MDHPPTEMIDNKHKKCDMINIKTKRCIEENCIRIPSYNLSTEITPSTETWNAMKSVANKMKSVMKVTNEMKLVIGIVNEIRSSMNTATEIRAAQCKWKLKMKSVNGS